MVNAITAHCGKPLKAAEKPPESGGKARRPVTFICSTHNNPAPDDGNKRMDKLAANLIVTKQELDLVIDPLQNILVT